MTSTVDPEKARVQVNQISQQEQQFLGKTVFIDSKKRFLCNTILLKPRK